MAHGTIIDLASRRPLLGTFHAIGCRDASSLERDGDPYVAVNELPTRTGRRECEIQFTDGLWLLADPTCDLVPAFHLDAYSGTLYLAHSYGEPWNGWATPVVDRETLARILRDAGEPHVWEGDRITIAGDERPFVPRPDGLYDTGFLGWTFVALDLDEPSRGWSS